MKGRILIVDNDAAMLSLLGEQLENEQWQVTAVSTSAEACSALAHEQFAVILTELATEPVDGLAVLREARRLQPRARAIVMTGDSTVERVMNAVRDGAYAYVTKPFNPSEPTLLAQRALEDQRLREENRRLLDGVRLAEDFLERAAAALRERVEAFDEGTSAPRGSERRAGNVRELSVNAAERAAGRGQGAIGSPQDPLIGFHGDSRDEAGSRPTLAELEIQYIRRVLAETKGDKRRAAEILGISVRTLQRMQAMSKLDNATVSRTAS